MIGIRMGFDGFHQNIEHQVPMLSVYQYVASTFLALLFVFEGYVFYLAALSIYRGYQIAFQYDLPEIKRHGIVAIALTVTAIFIWVLDIFTCNFFLNRIEWFPHWHAWWHVLTAIAFHETAQMQIYLFLKKMKQRSRFVTVGMFVVEVKCEEKTPFP